MVDVPALARHLAGERGLTIDQTAALSAPEARQLLADLLTARKPLPLPAEVTRELDLLLAREAFERPQIEASSIPTLVEEGCPDTLFTRRARIWRGDLTHLAADGIVNAANDQMLGCFVPRHACIDNVIHAAAGPALRAECAAHMNTQGHPEPTGTATVTAGYHLAARYVFHTVGPIVHSHQPSFADAEALASCYRSILDCAEALENVRTVGFCAISTGVFGYPKESGARVAVTAVRTWLDEYPKSQIEPIFSAFTAADEEHYRRAVTEEVSYEP